MALIRSSKGMSDKRRDEVMRHLERNGFTQETVYQTYVSRSVVETLEQLKLRNSYDLYAALDEWELPYKRGTQNRSRGSRTGERHVSVQRRTYEIEEVTERFIRAEAPELGFSDESVQRLAERLLPVIGPMVYDFCRERLREELSTAFGLVFGEG